ncbi:hypothetical protein [Vitreoscilla stercoraria]|uniref:Uncharacterized protein n=1 Tax=Vitreoscilla stercoraria TaxID=61 RepID=A0ABY4ECT6_VITST|nr:hypothetical protein [Vitreoscilla stercoraria]UOO93565.1 hypothetical protein LVJ81_05950 [Vitreoscilla stercoraria]
MQENQIKQHSYELHFDGLSTFLSIASTTLEQRQKQGELSFDDAVNLQNQVQATLFTWGAMAEAFATEQVAESVPSQGCASALLLTAKMMQQMATIGETLSHVTQVKRTPKPNASTTQAA